MVDHQAGTEDPDMISEGTRTATAKDTERTDLFDGEGTTKDTEDSDVFNGEIVTEEVDVDSEIAQRSNHANLVDGEITQPAEVVDIVDGEIQDADVADTVDGDIVTNDANGTESNHRMSKTDVNVIDGVGKKPHSKKVGTLRS
jgi:hypothetical protein